jgi:hypothetical protein
MRRVPWKPGAAAGADGELLVSLTDLIIERRRDVPRAWVAGMRLRHAWPSLEGAVGLWLWADPVARRSGSISVWTSEADLMRFVRWPVHVKIMRRYRDRGSLVATSWLADDGDPDAVWREAMRRLREHRP